MKKAGGATNLGMGGTRVNVLGDVPNCAEPQAAHTSISVITVSLEEYHALQRGPTSYHVLETCFRNCRRVASTAERALSRARRLRIL